MVCLAATSMAVLSFDADAASLLLKRRQAHSPKVCMGAGLAWGGKAEVDVSWGRVARTLAISSISYFFLILLKESLF